METYYAGIGSRKTPADVLDDMSMLSYLLRNMGVVLRSGGAVGADKAFETGAYSQKEIFTPNDDIPVKAFEIAEELHPNWNACSSYAKRLQARNVLQVLGKNLDAPVDFVVCWTSDGCENHQNRTRETGGTGQAIALASLLDIPVFNLANEGRLDQLTEFLDQYEV